MTLVSVPPLTPGGPPLTLQQALPDVLGLVAQAGAVGEIEGLGGGGQGEELPPVPHHQLRWAVHVAGELGGGGGT